MEFNRALLVAGLVAVACAALPQVSLAQDPASPYSSGAPADPGSTDTGTTTDANPLAAQPQPEQPAATPLAAQPLPQLLGPSSPMPTRPRRHAIAASPLRRGDTVPGTLAVLLPNGRAAAPADAPYAVKLIIWTANRLIGLPYKWGGGHASFADNAYDCSGAVSYALHAAGAIGYPEDSALLERWGRRGPGQWVTVYTNHGHAWMIVAGLRLDTSPVGDPEGLDGPRWRPIERPVDGFHVRHPLGL